MPPHDHTSVQQHGVASLFHSDELFDRWSPPAEMAGRLELEKIDQSKAHMRGQSMQGPRPTGEELKKWDLTYVEHYHIYDTYWSW